MDNILGLGSDFDKSWSFDKNGDLILTTNDANLGQAITNRLNTVIGEMDLYYENYGSLLYTFFGWQKTNETLQFLKIELDNCLKQDPRLNNFDIELKYGAKGELLLYLTVYFDDDTDLDYSFVITADGVIEDTGDNDGD